MKNGIAEFLWSAPDRPLKRQLKKVPGLVRLKRLVSRKFDEYSTRIDEYKHRHEIRTLEQLPLFVPNSEGSYEDLALQTVTSANQTFPFIVELIECTSGAPFCQPTSIENLASTDRARSAANSLERLFNKYGSDKATLHNYHHAYGMILSDPERISGLLEIGLGTNNIDVTSNMGSSGKPGASLRAFRDFLPNARVFGADVDRRILFEEDNIKTFFVDQTKPESFNALAREIECKLDVIIDDGLHSPNANIASLAFACKNLNKGGWFVVEDIGADALPVWRVISRLLPSDYKSWIVAAKEGMLFLLRRDGDSSL